MRVRSRASYRTPRPPFGVRKLADNLAMVVSQEGANPSGKGLVSHPYPNPEVDKHEEEERLRR